MSVSNLHEERIAALAYTYWLERGCPLDSPDVDWYRAVETLSAPEELQFVAFRAGPDTAAPAPRHHRRA